MRSAVFVDAGYLFAQGSVLLTGAKQHREFLSIDISNVVAALKKAARASCDAPMLRIYWYDAMRVGRPTAEQMALADANDIKVRLGQINAAGEQKGVDALIITDLAELSRNQAITDAVLVSGDEDVRVAVVLAQQFGVRVHLVGIHPARANQSRSLMQEADTTTEWDAATIGAFLTYTPPTSTGQADTTTAEAGLEEAIGALITGLPPHEMSTLKLSFASSTTVPANMDKALLRIGRAHYGLETLSSSERTALRTVFVRLVRER